MIYWEVKMSERKVIKLGQHGASMGPRELGNTIREEALLDIKQGFDVLFDFSGISVISSAFADEVFGKLFVELGEETFKNSVKVNNFDNEDSKKTILLVINNGIMFRKKQNLQK